MENCDKRKSWTLLALPPGSVPVRARFRPIHCSKKADNGHQLIGDAHIRSIMYGGVFESAEPDDFLPVEIVCSCE
jgi:hypothetical protein